jgi:GT2 family glycosyltransferase/glycosyltransferase involved in cell wall biosynthesis
MTLVVLTSYPWESVLAYLRYRSPAEKTGWQVLPGNQGKVLFTEHITQADVVLIQRDLPRYGDVYQQAIVLARQQHKPIVYEIDDLLIGVPDEHPFQGEYVGILNWMLVALMEADQVVTSTEALRQKLLPFNANTVCWPNYLVDEWWSFRSPSTAQAHTPNVIGYMGTWTHRADLALVEPVLLRLLDEHGPHLQLRFWGCPPPESLLRYSQVQWENVNVLEYPAFAAFFAQQTADIWIAPLQDTLFNRCKSAIKFLEYSALGAPGVYSRITPYQEIIDEGKTGFLAASPNEWYAALTKLITSADLRQRIAAQAQQETREHWLLSQHTAQWDTLFRAVQLAEPHEARKQEKEALIEIARQVQNHLHQRQQRIDNLTEEVRGAARHIQDLTGQIQDLTGQIQDLTRQIQALNEQIQGLGTQLAASQLRNLQLDEILSSRSWRLLQRLHKLRHRIIPVGSGREAIFLRALNLLGFRRAGGARLQAVSISVASEQYARWIAENESNAKQLAQQQRQVDALPYRPLISIVTPIYRPEVEHVQAVIHSVQAQTYPDWELCIVNGSPEIPHLRGLLEAATTQDDRIKVVLLDQNLGISGNSNAALKIARGEFVAFLDHDDVLSPSALFEVVQELNCHADWDLLYSDHDLLSTDGSQRFAPLFKPDWSPEIMLSSNYITHLTVIRKTLIDEIGGFRKEFDGAQDWDLFLRVVERTERVKHIPKVLYHWRDSPHSTAQSIWKKPYAPQAQLDAICAHLERKGLARPEACFDVSGFIRVRWWYDKTTRVSVIIPSNGANPLLERCIASILDKTQYDNFEVLVVNNGAALPETFPYYTNITRSRRVRVVHDDRQPFNYSAVNNFGAEHALGEVLVFLNNDTIVLSSDWLDEIVMWTSRTEIGIVGAKLLKLDGTIQHSGVILGLTGFAGHVFAGLLEAQNTVFGLTEWYRNYLAVTAACVAIRKDRFVELGGFNEALTLCGNDVELCLRSWKAGYRVVYNPYLKLYHEESATREGAIPSQDYRGSYEFYRPFLLNGDPYYNPNLSYWSLIPVLRKDNEEHPDDFAKHFLDDLKMW